MVIGHKAGCSVKVMVEPAVFVVGLVVSMAAPTSPQMQRMKLWC
jgi:hypothetical protein